MSGRAAQDEDAVRRMKLEVEIATRRQMHHDFIRSTKGPQNIEFSPQTIMRVSSAANQRMCLCAVMFNPMHLRPIYC
jgi:hypothetical protein